MPATVETLDLMTVRDCAKELGVIPRRVRQYIEEGRLPATQIARRWFITREDFENFRSVPRQPGNLTGEPRTPPKAK